MEEQEISIENCKRGGLSTDGAHYKIEPQFPEQLMQDECSVVFVE